MTYRTPEPPPSETVRLLMRVERRLQEMDEAQFRLVYERLGMKVSPETLAAPRAVQAMGLIIYTNGKHPESPSFGALLDVLNDLGDSSCTSA